MLDTLSPYFSWHVRNVSMICQIHMGWFGKRPSALWYNTNKDGCCTQQHTRVKEFDPPDIHLEMLLQENWIALLILFTAEKMQWKDDQKWDQNDCSFSLCAAFCGNVHCTCLWDGSDPLCVTMRCGYREATKGVPPHLFLCDFVPLNSSLRPVVSSLFLLLLTQCAYAVSLSFLSCLLACFLAVCLSLSMKYIRGLWPYSPSNWENSALQKVQNCNFAHIFNILDALRRTKKTNGLRRLPSFSQFCALGRCLKAIIFPTSLHLFRDLTS